MGVEIEKKFTVKQLPEDLDKYPFHVIEQAYLNVNPAIRVRREDDIYYMTYKGEKSLATQQNSVDATAVQPNSVNDATLQPDADNAKSHAGTQASHDIGKVEYNMPLDAASYEHLAAKADGNVIRKKRYLIPINSDAYDAAAIQSIPGLNEALKSNNINIERDVFGAPFEGRILAEVEFPSEEAARAYKPADWFDKEVTGDPTYSNSHMSVEQL